MGQGNAKGRNSTHDLAEDLTEILERRGTKSDGLFVVAEEVDFIKSTLLTMQRIQKKTFVMIESLESRTMTMSVDLAKLVDERRRYRCEIRELKDLINETLSNMRSV